ncbi:MAG: HisA/HisF-related TIM barrel protein, partial [Longimicrobiales bacterium]
TELLASLRNVVQVPIVASGGADTPAHMAEAVAAGADAVLAASIFHKGEWTVGRIKEELAELGVHVRPGLAGQAARAATTTGEGG